MRTKVCLVSTLFLFFNQLLSFVVSRPVVREGRGYVILSNHEMDTKFDEINVI